MPFVSQHTVATVLSTEVLSQNERSILVEAGGFEPMRYFLRHVAEEGSDVVEPAAKRRKTKSSSAPRRSVQSAPATQTDEIPLFRVAIDLHFPDTLHTKPVNADALTDDVTFEDVAPIAVEICGIDTDPDLIQMKLTSPGNGIVVVDCTNTITDASLDFLKRIALTDRAKGLTAKARPATSLRCTLKQSRGQLLTVLRLEVTLSWRSGVSAFPAGLPVGRARVYEDYEFLAYLCPDESRNEVEHNQPWTPRLFYDSVHVPDKRLESPSHFDNVLTSELYPFQKRAVMWMLGREGVASDTRGGAQSSKAEMAFFKRTRDADGKSCYVDYLRGIVCRQDPSSGQFEVSGGVLAEEMGLGKTVEVMALMSLHKRDDVYSGPVADISSGSQVTPSKATLIITPASILQQWKSELARHAPSLKVYQYEGVPSGNKGPSNEELVQSLSSKYDVILATYNVLGREVHFAEDPPQRDMRRASKYERKRSPLVQLQWFRLILDEAQMVESGVTAAARVAARLPRVHSWAVTGTPLRKNAEDLLGLLVFLRLKPFSENAKLWSHLLTNHMHLFARVFSSIALRHTKALVRDELRLPAQKRVVLNMNFSAIEQQHYNELFNEMCAEVGMHEDGSPTGESWDPNDPKTIETMRTWLVRLRQTCLHPQVGRRNRRALGRGREGPLRTVVEVLEVMIDQNETATRVEERAALASKLLQAHILGNNRADEHRSENAYAIFSTALVTSEQLVTDARQRLAEAEAAQEAEEVVAAAAADDEADSDSEGSPALGRMRNNIRTALQLHHVCTFFSATALYQVKTNENLTEPDSDKFKELEERETRLYNNAKTLRHEILKDGARKSETLMRKIRTMQDKTICASMPAIKDLNYAGIESRRITEKADDLFDVIRPQTKTISEWRAQMAEYLLKPLIDENEGVEATGDEYEASTQDQDNLYVYFDAVKAMQADLNSLITGESAPLIDHEVRTMVKDAKSFLNPEFEFKRFVHAPELLLELFAKRNFFRQQLDKVGSIRGLIQEARALSDSLQLSSARGESERALIRGHLSALHRVFSDYTKVIAALEKEVELFRECQNSRLGFYRQLQELSDAVAPYKEELDGDLDTRALEGAEEKETQLMKNLAQLKVKHRYLLHLREESAQSTPKICVICQFPFENGVLTVCGHQYCKECIGHWWTQHRTCPTCKRRLQSSDFHAITFKPRELKAQEENHSITSSPGTELSLTPSRDTSIYSDVDDKLLREIKDIDLPTSYGTKIDTLGRHLLWIRESDPGAKSVVFSQYREFLDVLGTALGEFKIGYSRLGKAKAVERFKNEPSIDCLLLDAKTDSSGLTLVDATHVFICEPLIQTAVELQAIARVHRIGQTRQTTIWMYLVSDTVEEAIYEISVARRLTHVQAQHTGRAGKSRSVTPSAMQESALDAANSEVHQSAPLSKLLVAGKGGGELVGNDDLCQCLFGKAKKEGAKASVELEAGVGRHLRAEAAEERRDATVFRL